MRDSTGFPSAVKLGPPPEQSTGNDQFGAKIAATASLIAISASNEDYGEGGVTLYSRRASGAWAVAGHLVGDVSTLPALTGANRECTGGKVSIFDCNQVDLMSFLPVSAIGGERGVPLRGVGGSNDPPKRPENAVLGPGGRTPFVGIRDASPPMYLGEFPQT